MVENSSSSGQLVACGFFGVANENMVSYDYGMIPSLTFDCREFGKFHFLFGSNRHDVLGTWLIPPERLAREFRGDDYYQQKAHGNEHNRNGNHRHDERDKR